MTDIILIDGPDGPTTIGDDPTVDVPDDVRERIRRIWESQNPPAIAASGTMELANPWHDEAGRFAPKGAHGGIKVITGSNKSTTVAQDLTLSGLPPEVQQGSIDRMISDMGVTPEQATENLTKLADEAWNKNGGDLAKAGAFWYDDAHEQSISDGHGFDPDVAVGVTAALSPGCEWGQNEAQARLVFDAVRNRSTRIIGDDAVAIESANAWAAKNKISTRVEAGDTLDTLYARSPELAAVYIARSGRVPTRSYDRFMAATNIAMEGPTVIGSELHGAKVRSFYNNLRDPRNYDGGNDVTVDTHMIRAMVAADTPGGYERMRSTAANSSAITGSPSYANVRLGAYPVMADTIRNATDAFNVAHGTDLLPSQFQAVTWVYQREVWPLGRARTVLNGTETN